MKSHQWHVRKHMIVLLALLVLVMSLPINAYAETSDGLEVIATEVESPEAESPEAEAPEAEAPEAEAPEAEAPEAEAPEAEAPEAEASEAEAPDAEAVGEAAEEVGPKGNLDAASEEELKLTLVGGSTLEIYQFHPYAEMGCQAMDPIKGDLSDAVQVTYKSEDGQVLADGIDTGLLNGRYIVEYLLTSDGKTLQAQRSVVIIEDLIAPTLTRNGDFMTNLGQGSTYVDAGARALDQNGLDISDRIQVAYRVNNGVLHQGLEGIESYEVGSMIQIIYQVTDFSGNACESVSRMVAIVAGASPIISLKGLEKVSIMKGQAYSDLGVSVVDDIDSDIQVITTITNPQGLVVDHVDTMLVGQYTIEYNAMDSDMNAAKTQTRLVEVVESCALEIKYVEDGSLYIKTGTAPFTGSADHVAGLDRSDSDEYVRTLDTVAYPLAYSVKTENKPAENLKLIGTITGLAGATETACWDESLGIIPNLVISEDKKTFVYSLGRVNGGQAFDFTATAFVLGGAKNNTQFTTQFKLVGDNAPEVSTSIHTSTVSAAPRVDLVLKKGRDDVEQNSEGKLGVTSSYGIGLTVKDGKGSEQLENPLKFTIDMDAFGVANVRLHENHPIGINGVNRRVDALPYGQFKSDAGHKSVFNSGTIVAKQGGPGQTIEIEINDVDVISGHYPHKNYNDSTISVDEKYVFAGYLRLWIDYEDLSIGNNPVVLTYKDLKVKGISGLDNYLDGDEPLANNSHGHDIIKRETGDGGYGYRIDYAQSVFTNTKLDTMTSHSSGDGSVVAGQKFATGSYLINSKFVDLSQAALMTKFDPDVMTLVDYDPATPGDQVYRTYGSLKDNYIVEYGVASFDDYADICNTVEPDNGQWYTDYSQAIAVGQVSMVRVRAINGAVLKNRESISLNLSLQAKSNAQGTILPIFGAVYAAEVNGGEWTVGRYNPLTNEDVSRGQRLRLTEVLARIDKDTKDSSLRAVTLSDGNNPIIEYVLTPTLTADSRLSNPMVSQDVIIRDTLPKGMTYIEGTASLAPTHVEDLPSGQSLMTWNLGKNINIDIQPITYKVALDFDLQTNTVLDNTVVIETQADLSAESLRTANKAITVINNQSWGIKENVLTPVVEVNDPITYEILYGQFKNRDMSDFELITVLPTNETVYTSHDFAGFSGSYSLAGVQVNTGEAIYATLDEPMSIEVDPKYNTSSWHLLSEVVANGQSDQVTGLKFVSPLFRSGEATRRIQVSLAPKNNQAGDRYGSFTSGRTDAIDLAVKSKEVLARVVASSIGDTLWVDQNKNGLVDSHEARLENVVVVLKKDGLEIQRQTTDHQGQYKFLNLHSGLYEVEVVASTVASDLIHNYDADGNLDQKVSLNLGVNADHVDADFGYYRDGVTGQIGDYIFLDLDKNGQEDPDDKGLEGVVVKLTKEGEASFLKEVVTGPDGKYLFDGLDLGTYKVSLDESSINADLELAIDPDGNALESSFSVTLTGLNLQVDHVDFGYQSKATVPAEGTIGDFVFEDKNKNGIYDGNDMGISGVKLTLSKGSDLVETTYTDDQGKYIFDKLPQGQYTVRVIASSVDMQKKLTVDPDASVDGQHQVTLLKNQIIDTVDFGFSQKEPDVTPDPTPVTPDPTPEPTPDTPEPTPEVVEKTMMGDLIVHHLDALTNQPLAQPSESQGEIGTSYQTQAVEFEDYDLIERTDNHTGLYKESKTVVIYYYSQVRVFEEEETPLSETEVPGPDTDKSTDLPSELPKTGETSNLPTSLLGLALLTMGGIGIIRRKKTI